MGMKPSPENIEFRRLVASYGTTAPLKIARELGCDVSKVHDARGVNNRQNREHEFSVEKCPYNWRIIQYFQGQPDFRMEKNQRLFWKGRQIGIEGLAKIMGIIKRVPSYD